MTNPAEPVPPPGCPAHGSFGAALHGTEFADDPHGTYARLRADYGPVAPVLLDEHVEASLVVSYDAALEVLRSPEVFTKDPRGWNALREGRLAPDNPVLPMMAYRPNALLTHGEEHARLRAAIVDSLKRVEPLELREYVERAADILVDGFGPAGKADLRREFALAVPLLVFMEMFGCPPDIAEKMVRGMSGIFELDDAEQANAMLTEGIVELVALKRAQPGPDVTSWLMAHASALTDEEVVHQLALLMGAGTEPQQNLISNALRLLLTDDRFAGRLSGGTMPVEDALDEVLWADPPMANFGVHYPVRDTDLAGVRMRAGEPVVVSFAAANTDPALPPHRRMGNRAHLAWSAGPHACPAKESARLIASVAIERLLDRVPDMRLTMPVEELPWRPGPFHRSLAELPVTFPRVLPKAADPPTVLQTPSPQNPAAPHPLPPRPEASEPQLGDSTWPSSSPSLPTLPTRSQDGLPEAPASTSSTPQDAISTERTPDSAPEERRRGLRSLAVWKRGRSTASN